MAMPDISLRQLLEAGVHFGHQTERWNPKMAPYIYGARNGIHIIDLTQTLPMFQAALQVIYDVVSKGGRVLFVGTKRQAQSPVAEAAERSAQYFMNHRWLGGTLTNWNTVSNSINRLNGIDEQLSTSTDGLTKKERLGLEREQAKLQASLGGIREMGNVPDLLFVIDVKKEALAVLEAKKLGIPVIGVVDTNCTPDGVDYIIPGNDDAGRAIALYCDLVSRTILEGMNKQIISAGIDIGASDNPKNELASEAKVEEEPVTATPAQAPKDAPAEPSAEAAEPTPPKEQAEESPTTVHADSESPSEGTDKPAQSDETPTAG